MVHLEKYCKVLIVQHYIVYNKKLFSISFIKNGFRGRRSIRNLKKEDSNIESEPDGLKYVIIVKNENEKIVKCKDYRDNHQNY